MSNAVTQERSGTQRRMMAGPTVWNQESLRAEDYMITVEPHQAAACLRIRDGLRSRGRRLDSVEPSEFQSQELAEIARGIRHRVRSGPGFCVLRGLPLQGWTDEEASMLYWAWAPTWAARSRRTERVTASTLSRTPASRS